jgi:hypothetical protein
MDGRNAGRWGESKTSRASNRCQLGVLAHACHWCQAELPRHRYLRRRKIGTAAGHQRRSFRRLQERYRSTKAHQIGFNVRYLLREFERSGWTFCYRTRAKQLRQRECACRSERYC